MNSLPFQIMEDEKSLADYGLNSSQAKAQNPAEVGLAVQDNGTWEELEKVGIDSVTLKLGYVTNI